MSKDLYTFAVTTVWLMSALSLLTCETYKNWKHFPLAVNLILIATYLLPLLIHIKKPKGQDVEYVLYDQDTKEQYTIQKETFNAIRRINEVKAGMRGDK